MKSNRPRCEPLETREALSGLHALHSPLVPAIKHFRHAVAILSTRLHPSTVASPSLAATTTPTPATTATATATSPTPAPSAPLPAAGTSTGSASLTFATRQTNAQVGTTYDFDGTGGFGPLATGKAVGSIETVGSDVKGRAGGTLTFGDGQGAIVLKVTGPVQSAGASMPSRLDYTVWGGYGSYAGAQGAGTVGVQLSGSTATLSFQHA